MSTGICNSPDSRYWRALYKAALSEIGNSKLPERIAEAEKAVVLRARELFQAADDNGEEKEALERTRCMLCTLYEATVRCSSGRQRLKRFASRASKPASRSPFYERN